MKLEIDIPYYVFEQVKRENTIKNVLNRIDFAIRNGVERPHGEWNMDKRERVYLFVRECLNCKKKSAVGNFCMCCGADMRPKEGETEGGESK